MCEGIVIFATYNRYIMNKLIVFLIVICFYAAGILQVILFDKADAMSVVYCVVVGVLASVFVNKITK